jgi:hypothetical protein
VNAHNLGFIVLFQTRQQGYNRNLSSLSGSVSLSPLINLVSFESDFSVKMIEVFIFAALLVREFLRPSGVRSHGHVPLVLHRGPPPAQRPHHRRLSLASRQRLQVIVQVMQ